MRLGPDYSQQAPCRGPDPQEASGAPRVRAVTEAVGLCQGHGSKAARVSHWTFTSLVSIVVGFSRSVLSDSCNPMDCSLPGSSAHGVLQAGIPEWVALPSSRGSS